MNAKETLTEWLADGDLERVIAGLRMLCKNWDDPTLTGDINFQSGRYQDLKNNHLQGLVSQADYQLEMAKIRRSLQETVHHLASHWPADGLEEIPQTQLLDSLVRPNGPDRPRDRWKKRGMLPGILAALALVVGYTWKSCFGAEYKDSLQLTVYVHGPKSPSDVVLQNTGKLLITLDNDRRSAIIGENGRTNFGEIPAGFRGQEILVGLEAEGYELAFPGKKYRLGDEPVYLEVKRDNALGIIQGIVKDRSGEHFIGGALVMIDQDTTTTTDSLGRFRILLPPDHQRETYSLTIKKAGFKVKNEYYKPKSGKIEVRLER